MKTCKNCAWYCHFDGCCYGTKARLDAEVPGQKPLIPNVPCFDWTYDGLEEWERTDCERTALMTMETVC